MTSDPSRTDHFVRRDGKVYAGTHLIVDVVGGQNLDNVEAIEMALRRCVEACKVTLLHMHVHRFAPQGLTGIAILAESHMSIHTWPEAGYAAFDAFMCGATEPWNAIDILRDIFQTSDVRVTDCIAERTSSDNTSGKIIIIQLRMPILRRREYGFPGQSV